MIKAVIFDMDGLLIDSEPYWRRAHIETLGKHGFVVTEEEVKKHAGLRTSDEVELWHKRFGWKEPSKAEMTNQIVGSVIEFVQLNGKALPGVYEVIEILKSHGIPMGLASSSSLDLIEVVIERLSLKEDISYIRSGEQEKRGKPFPDVFLSTARDLKVEPSECLVFEDSLNGVKAAKAAGMKCIAVPEHPHDPSKFGIADVIVSSLEKVDWKMISAL